MQKLNEQLSVRNPGSNKLKKKKKPVRIYFVEKGKYLWQGGRVAALL
jgi:hypothetical protein